jgi:UDP-GlcNAc:undecaprenyl-phosphate/decaprenyl-phosphate GlcNAc-1-phosphate transferase
MTTTLMSSASAFLIAVAAGFLLTPLVARIATRTGVVSPPRPDRWGSRPTPLLGGVAVIVAILIPTLLLAPPSNLLLLVVAGTVGAFALGVVDDVRGLRPTSKLVGQIVIGSALAVGGVRVELITFAPVAFVATLLWVVLIMNAVNLSDNMDGLAAGIVAIGSFVLILMSLGGLSWSAILAASTAGACIGFLAHNVAPARVYMGDAGSLPLGFILAALTLVLSNQAASNVGLAILAPLLVLGLPIFDTALVTIVRRLEGRPVSRGGRDHTSHRLAMLGLSERWTVAVLYLVAGGMAALSLVASLAGLVLIPLAALALIGLVLFGSFLVENPLDIARQGEFSRATIVGRGRALVRYGGEIALDVGLSMIALFSAYLLRFESFAPQAAVALFMAAMPIVVPIQLAAFVLLGQYRILWRYLSVVDMFVIARSVLLGTAVAGAVVLLTQADLGQSRGVFIIDAVLLSLLIGGSRMFAVSLRQWFRMRGHAAGRRVLIVGANETGAMALRLLLRADDQKFSPAGFLDDDPGKHRRRIAGVPVVGRVSDLVDIARRERAEVVVLALEDDSRGEAAVRLQCQELGLELREVAPRL